MDSRSTLNEGLFRLAPSPSPRAFNGAVDQDVYNKLKDSLFRGEASPQRAIRIEQRSGRAPQDFVWTALGPAIHSRIAELWTLAGVSGWSTYPVEIFDRAGKLVQGYHGLSVLGRCRSMFLDGQHSAVVYEQDSRGRFPYYRGLFVDVESWDGTDIFTAEDGRTGFTIVTQKVWDPLVKAKATNFLIQPISEVRLYATDQPRFLISAN